MSGLAWKKNSAKLEAISANSAEIALLSENHGHQSPAILGNTISETCTMYSMLCRSYHVPYALSTRGGGVRLRAWLETFCTPESDGKVKID